jgi:hypothetical protein
MERKYLAIITGPREYLENGFKAEILEITQDNIDEYLSDGDGWDTEEDAIVYYKEEYAAEWEQRWCQVSFLSESQFSHVYEEIDKSLATELCPARFNGDPNKCNHEETYASVRHEGGLEVRRCKKCNCKL